MPRYKAMAIEKSKFENGRGRELGGMFFDCSPKQIIEIIRAIRLMITKEFEET
jgi:hypothetical protein